MCRGLKACFHGLFDVLFFFLCGLLLAAKAMTGRPKDVERLDVHQSAFLGCDGVMRR